MPRGPLTHHEFRELRRFPALDGLRTVSIVLVVFAHSRNLGVSYASQGINGVVLFFVLSGFLITSLSLREESKYGRVRLRAFAVRRAFRILPLYYAVLALYAVLVLALHVDPRSDGFKHALPYYLLFFQEHVRFAPHPPSTPFYPYEVVWSLGIEEKFYLLWPALMFFALWRARRWRLPVAVVLTVVTGLMPMILGRNGIYFMYYAAILCGCVVALLLHNPRTYRAVSWFGSRAGLTVAVAAVLIGYGLTYFQYGDGWLHFLCTVTLFPACAVLVAGLVTTTASAPRRALDWRPVVLVGQASYAMYLLHLIFLNGAEKVVPARFGLPGDVVAVLIAIVTCAVACIGVQRWFEGPITVYGHRLADRRFPRRPVAELLEPLDVRLRAAQLADGAGALGVGCLLNLNGCSQGGVLLCQSGDLGLELGHAPPELVEDVQDAVHQAVVLFVMRP